MVSGNVESGKSSGLTFASTARLLIDEFDQPWRQHLPYLVDTYKRYRQQGFEIVGVALSPDSPELDSFIRRHGMTWRNVVGDRRLPSRYGIFGEATSFLLDRDGIIIGRNLRGAELTRALVESLGLQQELP